MAYSNTIFQAIPAVYALLPRPQKRRTATNIMAGYFDPLPTPPSEHDASSSRASSPDDHIHSVPARKSTTTTATTRIGTKKGKLSARKNVRRGPLLAAGLPDHDLPSRKGKAIAHVVSDEKENEIALSDNDGESSDSLSPPPPSPPRANPHLPVSTSASTPKASGFWRARSSNASDAPTLKRKRSAQAEQPSEPRQATLTKAVKKPRVSAPAVVEPRSRIFYSTSPSLASSASLSSAVSEPIEMPEHPTDVQYVSPIICIILFPDMFAGNSVGRWHRTRSAPLLVCRVSCAR